jgi:hypothetical protein
MRFIFMFLTIFMAISFQFSNALAVTPMPSEIEKEIERKSFEKLKNVQSDTICNVDVYFAGDVPDNRYPPKKHYFLRLISL